MAKSRKVVKLKVVPQNKLHYQDRVDYHFDMLKELLGEYCSIEDQDLLELLHQSACRVSEAEHWWEMWKNAGD